MIDLLAVMVANGAAVMLLSILFICVRRNKRYWFLDEILFYTMMIFTFLQCVFETAAFAIDGQMEVGYHALSVILNSSLYVNNILYAFVWTLYADYKLFKNTSRLKKIYPFVFIPAALIIIGVFVNLFTPVFFTISPENVYQRTGAYIIPYAFTYLYLLYGVVLIYAYKNKVKKYLFLPAIMFMFPILVGSILQYLYYGLSLVWCGVAIGLVTLYINLQNESSYVDEMSGLFTRQYLNNYMSIESKKMKLNKMNSGKMLMGIMLDIDKFKSINDSFGHLVGDKAIASAGEVLRSCDMPNGFVCRYAGDEFVVVAYVKEESEIRDLMKSIVAKTEEYNRTANQPYDLQFSMGYSIFHYGTDTIDTFLGEMDAAMYADKRRKIQEKILPERRER